MADEKDMAIEKEQETIRPAGAKKDELSEADLKKAVGGSKTQGDFNLS